MWKLHLVTLLFFALVAYCAVSPQNSLVYGPGINKIVAGVLGTIYITLVDTNGNNITTCNYQSSFVVTITQGSSTIAVPNVGCSENYPPGQYNVVFTIKVVGSYSVSLNFSGTPIAKSPYSLKIVPAPPYGPNCKASGSGLSNGIVGFNRYFQIVTYDQFNNLVPNCYALSFWKVSLSGASSIKGDVFSCQDNKGLYNATYYAKTSGYYVLSVQFNSSNVINQALTLSPGALDPSMCSLQVEGGSATVGSLVIVDIIQEDSNGNLIQICHASDWTGFLTRSGTTFNISVSCNADKVPVFNFTVNEAGTWEAYVYYQNRIIANGEIDIDIIAGPVYPANTRAEGEGLIEGIAGVPTYVFIIPYDQYDNRIRTCEPLSNFKVSAVSQNCTSNMFKCDNGNYSALYICDLAIQVQFSITYKGSKISNSPIYPTIIAGPPSAPQCYAEGTGTVEAQAGQAAIFTIVTYDQYDNKIAQCIPQSQWAEAWQITVHDSQVVYNGAITNCSSGEYTASYTIIQLSQLYILDIFYYSNPISNSGFTLTTYAGPPYPPYCNASGPGLSGSQAGVATWSAVVCSDQYKNPISSCRYVSTNWTAILNNTRNSFDGYYLNCTPAKYATVYIGYNITIANEYEFFIFFNNYTVHDDYVTIVPGPYDPDNTAAYGPGVGQNGDLPAGGKTIFYLVGRDKWNNTIHECPSSSDWTITIVGQSDGTVVSYTIVGCSTFNGMTNVTYIPTAAQTYKINIKLNGSYIFGNPYYVNVIAGAPSVITGNGTGTVSGIAGELTSFDLYLFDQYHNSINYCGFESDFTVYLSGNQQVTGYVNCNNGFYYGYYNATKAGTYTMTVNFNGKQISNSPFKPVITANVIYGPNCLVSGDKTEYAGEKGSLSISCSDAWNNAINNCNQNSRFDASSNNNHFTFASDFVSCSNGVYSTTYNGTQATTVTITITWSGTQIGNSPFNILIIPNYIVAMNSEATGNGLQNNVVGNNVYIDITGYDWWDNVNTTCFSRPAWGFNWLRYPKGGNVTISQYSNDFCNQGTYTYTYRTTVIGRYTLEITWLNDAIDDSPWSFSYSAGPPDPAHSIANGTGTENIVAGKAAYFNIYTLDSFGNPVSNCSYMNWQIGFGDPTYSSQQTKISCDSSTGVFTVKYYGYQTGTWVLTVRYGGVSIQNSPFNVKEVANVIYAATSIVDLSKTTNVLASQTYTFEIITRDQWKNNNISCAVPLSSFGVSIQSSDSKTIFTGVVYDCVAGSHWDAAFTVNISGTYYLSVFYENQLVSNQTYILIVDSGTVYDANCVVSGPLISKTQIAGIASLVQITQYDQYMNQNTTCLNNYWLIKIYTQGVVYYQKYVPISNCKNGVYSVYISLETAMTYSMNVSGDIGTTHKSPYSIYVINNEVYASNSAILINTIPKSSVIGAPVSILIDLRDRYNNPVLNCNMTNSFWSMVVNITSSIKFSTHCQNGNNNMTMTYAFTHSYSAQDAWVRINVLYSKIQVINSPYSYELLPGQPSAYSYAAGHGVEDYWDNLAGDWVFFDIYAVNEYNISIPGCASFKITYSPDVIVSSSSCVHGITAVQYNATLATAYSISITLNGKRIAGSSYTGVVYPNVMDLAMTEYYGPLFNSTPANDSGTFNLRVRDHWGNSELNIGPDLFTGVLTPACSNTSVDCTPEEDGVYNCTYSVQNGGTYCFVVSYNNTILPGFTPIYLDIIGGLGCDESCNYNGYCIAGNCSCTTKYAGSSCQYKISSHYMTMGLAIGLIIGLSIAFLLIGLIIGCLLARMTSKGSDRLLN